MLPKILKTQPFPVFNVGAIWNAVPVEPFQNCQILHSLYSFTAPEVSNHTSWLLLIPLKHSESNESRFIVMTIDLSNVVTFF